MHAAGDAATLVTGLRVLSSNGFHVPLVVSGEYTRLTGAKKTLTVTAGTAIGEQGGLLEVEAALDNVQGAKKAVTLTLSAVGGKRCVRCHVMAPRNAVQLDVLGGPVIAVAQARRGACEADGARCQHRRQPDFGQCQRGGGGHLAAEHCRCRADARRLLWQEVLEACIVQMATAVLTRGLQPVAPVEPDREARL